MTDALPYAAPQRSTGPVSLEVSNDRVVLTVMPVRGLALGALVFETAACTGVWAMWTTLLWRFFGIRNLLPALSWSWEIFGVAIVQIVFPLVWATEVAVRWIRYWKHGDVPLRLDASGSGILVTRPGLLRAIKRRHFATDDIGRVDVVRTKDIFGRRPRVLVKILNRSNRRLILAQARGDETTAERAATEFRRVLGIGVPRAKHVDRKSESL